MSAGHHPHRSGMLAVTALVAGVLISACTADEPIPAPSRSIDAARLMREYVSAIATQDPETLRPLVGYSVMDTSDAGGTLVTGEALPTSCLDHEIRALTAAGVTDRSSVEIMGIGGEDVEVDGGDALLSFAMQVGQIGLPDGSSVGRGIIELAGGSLVQLEPNDACDEALRAVT